MIYRVVLRPEAEFEVAEAYHWYEEQVEGLGEEFLRAVDACLAAVQRTPAIYPLIHEEVRRALLRKFPYCIFYLIESNTVVILACFHARRDPKQWQDRM
ncbi:MAG: type II toxin-antitoxin system RelE/ParE family toxin [Chloroflexota bacterium]|nr:type II toxin-antitoxin system RelE/ParE family toxin [Chloroflexota bacterium]